MTEALRRIRYILTLRCEEASRLTSDSLDRSLAWYERLALSGHRLSCKSCRMLKRQLTGIHDACRKGSESGSIVPDNERDLGVDRKQRILAAMRQNDANEINEP